MTRKRRLILISMLVLSVLSVFLAILPITGVYAQPEIEWDKTFGGNNWDEGRSVQQTTDGGFIVTGFKSNPANGDLYLIKTDPVGNLAWERTFGGNGHEIGQAVQQTFDGGYIITGFTRSFEERDYDVYLIKVDSDGNLEWEKKFGDPGYDEGYDVKQTFDEGYIIIGSSLIKTDSDGNKIWEQPYEGGSVQQTTDGGYIITGDTDDDIYLTKTDPTGNKIWEKTFGGLDHEYMSAVKQTFGGGYIIVGTTLFATSSGYVDTDVYLIKTCPDGNMMWERTLQGSSTEGHDVRQTNDGGYIITGRMYIDEHDLDVRLIKLESEALWGLRELKGEVLDLPDEAFKRTKYARFWRKALLRKLTIVEKLVKRGNYRYARRFLKGSIKGQIMWRIREPWKSGLLDWVDYTINNIPFR